MPNDLEVIYSNDTVEHLEFVWGEGFLSPGGTAEVARILHSVNLSGCDVLDIGSGTGGVDISLIRDHVANKVIGVDVEQSVIDLATRRVQAQGLSERIVYQLIKPGPLPFEDNTFDVVFSKDAIIHISYKEELYAEIYRVLRPGGRLAVSDWLRGGGKNVDDVVDKFLEASGRHFTMITLSELEKIVNSVGFICIETENRGAWYLEEAKAELRRLRGPLQPQFLARWDQKSLQEDIAFWEVLVESLEKGALSPSHIRAWKPS